MGSFNLTCFASLQTIASGDPCYVLPVIRTRSDKPAAVTGPRRHTESLYGALHSDCYPTAFWKPCGTYLAAHYNDYGCVKLDATELNTNRLQRFIRILLDRAGVVEEGESETHDLPYNVHQLVGSRHELRAGLQGLPVTESKLFAEAVQVFDSTWRVAQKHRLFVADDFGVLSPIQFAIIHKVAYDNLVAISETVARFEDVSYAPRDVFQRAVAAAKAEVADLDAGDSSALAVASRSQRAFREVMDVIAGGRGPFFRDEHREMGALLGQHLRGQLDENQFFERCLPAMTPLYVYGGMEYLSLRIQPSWSTHDGIDNAVGKMVAEFIHKTHSQVAAAHSGKN